MKEAPDRNPTTAILSSKWHERSDFDSTAAPPQRGTVYDLVHAIFTCCQDIERFKIVEYGQGRAAIVTPGFDIPVRAREQIKLGTYPGVTLLYRDAIDDAS